MGTGGTESRLSRIRTHWTAVFEAHRDATPTNEARNQLIHRYLGAVYRYLLGAVRDPDLAGDLCQEFAVRFLRGDLRAVHPDRGRFRDYVRTVLINLVNDAHRARVAAPMHLAEFGPVPHLTRDASAQSEEDFLAAWREELLARTWESLRKSNLTYHAVLWLRIDEPELTSPDMAKRLSSSLGREISAENVRKSLGRAQAKFAELLFEEVAATLSDPTPDDLERELQTLDLLRYCRTAWERRKSKGK